MNPETIDSEFAKLQQEIDQGGQAIQAFAAKLQSAAGGGDANAREWLLDLKSIALQVQQEQLQTQAVLQALHDFTVNHLSADPEGYASQPQYQQPQYQQPQYQQPVYAPSPSTATSRAAPAGCCSGSWAAASGEPSSPAPGSASATTSSTRSSSRPRTRPRPAPPPPA